VELNVIVELAFKVGLSLALTLTVPIIAMTEDVSMAPVMASEATGWAAVES
jgi:hypothetical protein